jgi:putative transcription factor
MLCELCGKETKFLEKVNVEGVVMGVCEGCQRYGKPVDERPAPQGEQPVHSPRRIYREKDIYEKMDRVLISNWAQAIEKAREKKGMTREELGAAIGERTVTIANIENEELHPTDKMIKNLEKELDITLMEKLGKPVTTGGGPKKGITLGDFFQNDAEES